MTGHARTRLHRQMIKIGPERILYCDTDSIIFLYSRHTEATLASRGLGNWVDEPLLLLKNSMHLHLNHIV